ncbi:MAG: hypothetical protein J6M05_03355 [Cardiobacteriaceae bacterium]|nr:hypothetical protein [Cardiobacteriaceae bacterium]
MKKLLYLLLFSFIYINYSFAYEIEEAKWKEAVKRVLFVFNANYGSTDIEELLQQLNKYELGKNVFYLGSDKEDNTNCTDDDYGCVELFMVITPTYVSIGNNVPWSDVVLSFSSNKSRLVLWEEKEFFRDVEKVGTFGTWLSTLSEIKQNKSAPYSEFLFITFDPDPAKDEDSMPNVRSLKCQQNFRFYPNDLKMQAIDKKKCVGKA